MHLFNILLQFIPVIAKLNFQQPSVSHDPSEIILICWVNAQESFLIIVNAENSAFGFFDE